MFNNNNDQINGMDYDYYYITIIDDKQLFVIVHVVVKPLFWINSIVITTIIIIDVRLLLDWWPDPAALR